MQQLSHQQWPRAANVQALITTRFAFGISAAPFHQANLGDHVGDQANAVAANRRELQHRLRFATPITFMQQVHGIEVSDLDQTAIHPAADACITRNTMRACAVLTADCLPVLFAANDGSIVAAAHAGWRGLLAGVLEATVAAMQTPAAELSCYIGPGISATHFEVGDEVRDAFCSADARTAFAFVANPSQRWQCDLPALAKFRLTQMGLGAIYQSADCSYRDQDLYYSHRRDAGATGRFASMVWIS